MNVKTHIWSWEPFGRGMQPVCACLRVSAGRVRVVGGGALSIFHSWHISLGGGARRCDKKVVHLGACDARCVIVSPVA